MSVIIYFLSCILSIFCYNDVIANPLLDYIEFDSKLTILAEQLKRSSSPLPLINLRGTCAFNAAIQLLEVLWRDKRFQAVTKDLAADSSDQSLQAQANRALISILNKYATADQFDFTRDIQESLVPLLCKIDPNRYVLNTDPNEFILSSGSHPSGTSLLWLYLIRSLLNGPVGLINVSSEARITSSYQDRVRVFGIVYRSSSASVKSLRVFKATQLENDLFFNVDGMVSTRPDFLSYIQVRWDPILEKGAYYDSYTFPLSCIMPNHVWYDCCGLLCEGKLNSNGEVHAVAYVLYGNQWYLCDDLRIEKVTAQYMQESAKAGYLIIPDTATVTPHVFLYRKRPS